MATKIEPAGKTNIWTIVKKHFEDTRTLPSDKIEDEDLRELIDAAEDGSPLQEALKAELLSRL